MKTKTFFTLTFFWICVLLLCPLYAYAQNIGKLSGKIIDKQNNQALEFVNIAVFAHENDPTISPKLVGGGITDIKGAFKVDMLPLNTKLFVRVSSIGYENFKTETFTILANHTVYKMENIALSSSSISLNAVEIKGQKRMIEYALDKKIVNVEQSLVSDGGTATDVLQNVPSVTVDEDGNVSMKGSENVTILIDGRPAVLSGLGLDQISAGSIESIEIISNPSAKYNPEGMAGILNIKTKKRTTKDLNGIVNLSLSSANQYSGSVNLNAGLGKVTLFTSLDINYRQRRSEGSSSTLSYKTNPLYPGDNMEWEVGSSYNDRKGFGGQLLVGADWRITENDLFSASVKGGMWSNNRLSESPYTLSSSFFHDIQNGTYPSLPPDLDPSEFHFLEALSNYSDGKSRFNQVNTALSYKHSFKKPEQELSINATLDVSMPNSSTTTTRTIENYYSIFENNIQTSRGSGEGFDFDGQINYSHPFGKNYKLEVGYQAKMRYNSSFDRQSLRIYERQDTAIDFSYLEQNHGVYANFAGEVKGFSFQVGGRFELANMDASTASELKDTTFQYFHPRFYPAIHLSYKIGKMQEIQLSYTRRVNRPRPWNLNPFINYSNYPSSISFGNPELRPEDIHSVELNYSLFYKASSFFVTVYYRRIEDVIRRYNYEREDGVRVSTFMNYESGTNYGFDLTYEQRVFSWWRFSLSGSLYQNITKGSMDASVNSEGLSYNLRFNTSFSLPKDYSIQFSCNYRGPTYSGQSVMDQNFAAELAARKGFFKNRFTVGLRISDVFNTRQFNRTTTGSNFTTVVKRKPLNSTAVFLTLSYKINQGLKNKARPSTTGSVDMGGMEDM